MCLASLYARNNNFEHGKEACVPLEVSGAEGIVNCYISPQDNHYIRRVKISAHHKIKEVGADIGTKTIPAKLIHLNGITHMCPKIIVISTKNRFPPKSLEITVNIPIRMP